MAELKVTVAKREDIGKNASRRLRATGKVPAVLYGEKRDPVTITVDGRVLDKVLHSESGENTIFELKLEGTDRLRNAMIKDFQVDPVTDAFVHADFIRIAEDRELQLSVQVVLEGVAYGVKTEGGRLDFPVREVMVSCLPKDIPNKFVVDVTELRLHDSVHASDLELPEGVTLDTDPSVVLATLHERAEEEPSTVEAVETPEGETPDTAADEEPKEESTD